MGIKYGNKVFLPQFNPDYYTQIYTPEYVALIRKQIKQIHKQLKHEVVDLDLVLDGGNFVSNGEVVIMTDKVIIDNPDLDINLYFREKLNMTPIIIKQSEYDKLGHTDGYLSFINRDIIALSHYPNELRSLKSECEQLLQLKLQFQGLGFKVIDVFDRPVDEKTISHGDWLYSARGIFINNLILNDSVIFPEFNLPTLKNNKNFNLINQNIYKELGFKVKTIQSDSLSKLGGGIHCVSWCF